MKSEKIKMLRHLLICIIISFVCIYLFVFVGGWRLFETGDVILLEVAASIGVGIIIWIIYEFSLYTDSRIKELEKRILELENKQ